MVTNAHYSLNAWQRNSTNITFKEAAASVINMEGGPNIVTIFSKIAYHISNETHSTNRVISSQPTINCVVPWYSFCHRFKIKVDLIKRSVTVGDSCLKLSQFVWLGFVQKRYNVIVDALEHITHKEVLSYCKVCWYLEMILSTLVSGISSCKITIKLGLSWKERRH